jgi:hypothetical protein
LKPYLRSFLGTLCSDLAGGINQDSDIRAISPAFLPGFSCLGGCSLVPLQLALTPMLSFRDWSNTRSTWRFNALNDTDARHHGRPVELDDQEEAGW